MTPLRLAFIGDPNSVHVRRWMAFFLDAGHSAFLLDGFGTEIRPGLDPRVDVERYEAGRSRIPLLSRLQTRRNLRRALDRIRPDILHAHFVRRYGWQAGVAGFHPLIVSGWGSDVLVGSLRTWRVRWRDRQALRAADLVTVVSPFMRDAIVANGARAERVELVHHGVDTARFVPGPPDPALLADGRRVILSPRAIRPLYRHETVIAAFAALPDDTLLIMSALDADTEYLARLRSQMRDVGVEDRVRVLDHIGEEDLPRQYRAASVVVSVPESDSFPVTLLEAMACGAPIVAGDLPPIRAVLGSLVPGALVPIGDPAALAAAMNRALGLSPQERGALGSALREHVVQTADYETNMSRMEALYRRLIR